MIKTKYYVIYRKKAYLTLNINRIHDQAFMLNYKNNNMVVKVHKNSRIHGKRQGREYLDLKNILKYKISNFVNII